MDTIVTVTPSPTIVQPGQAFTVTISVAPAVAIAGVQFNLVFNPKALQVNSITEGGIFDQNGKGSYFMPGTIDNVNGLVKNVADVIIGPNSVITSGNVAVLNCTAVTAGQTSAFTLSNVIVGNPAGVAVPLGPFSIIQTAVVLPWDLNSDGKVNAADVTLLISYFSQTGAPGWVAADFNSDGVVNVLDLITMTQHWTI
jgi:hypothetical protein